MKNYEELSQAIRRHLNSENIRFIEHEGNDCAYYTFPMNIPGQLSRLVYIIQVYQNEYIVYAILPVTADSSNMDTVSEFINKANFGLKAGNFELSPDGDLRFKYYVNCKDSIPSDRVVHDSIVFSSASIILHSFGFTGILFNGMTAQEAIDLCFPDCEDGLCFELEQLLEEFEA